MKEIEWYEDDSHEGREKYLKMSKEELDAEIERLELEAKKHKEHDKLEK